MSRITANEITDLIEDTSKVERVGFVDISVSSLWNFMLIRTEESRERMKYPDKYMGNSIQAVNWLLQQKNYYLTNTSISYPFLRLGSEKFQGNLYKDK